MMDIKGIMDIKVQLYSVRVRLTIMRHIEL
jgi:hypothetical protein